MTDEKIEKWLECCKDRSDCEGCQYQYDIDAPCVDMKFLGDILAYINRLKAEKETAAFNCEQAESQGAKINEMYGHCLMENNLLKDRIADLEAEKAVSDRALELAVIQWGDVAEQLKNRFIEQAKQELEKERK